MRRRTRPRAAWRLSGALVHFPDGPLDRFVEDLLGYLARQLVDQPDEVRVTRTERDGAAVLQLRVAPDDVGKVIGRHGRVARALRTLVRASGTRAGERTLLEIVED